MDPGVRIWIGPDGGVWLRIGFASNAQGKGKGNGKQHAQAAGDSTSGHTVAEHGENLVEGGEEVGDVVETSDTLRGLHEAQGGDDQGDEGETSETRRSPSRSVTRSAAQSESQHSLDQTNKEDSVFSDRFDPPVAGPSTTPQRPRQPFSRVLR